MHAWKSACDLSPFFSVFFHILLIFSFRFGWLVHREVTVFNQIVWKNHIFDQNLKKRHFQPNLKWTTVELYEINEDNFLRKFTQENITDTRLMLTGHDSSKKQKKNIVYYKKNRIYICMCVFLSPTVFSITHDQPISYSLSNSLILSFLSFILAHNYSYISTHHTICFLRIKHFNRFWWVRDGNRFHSNVETEIIHNSVKRITETSHSFMPFSFSFLRFFF